MTTAPLPVRPTLTQSLRRAVEEVHALAVDGVRRVVRPSSWRWQWAIVLTWVAGIGGDAYTTLSMMSTGIFEEANPVAAAGMRVLGVVGFTVAASALCAALAVMTLGRPRGLFGHCMWVALMIVGVAKAYTAASNALLWISV